MRMTHGLLLLMSTTYTTEKKNKYELHTIESSGKVFRLNTETGTVDYMWDGDFKYYKTYTIDGPVQKCWDRSGNEIMCE